jgi:hypothetical protein
MRDLGKTAENTVYEVGIKGFIHNFAMTRHILYRLYHENKMASWPPRRLQPTC